MKKHLILFSLLIIVLASCQKGNLATQQATLDDEKIQAYIKANSITGLTKDPSGIYYKVLRAGTGAYPVARDTVQVSTTGDFLNGSQFDHEASVSFGLPSTIQGYQIGIPHINPGGRILILVPSALGYGTTASSTVPANSVLVFTVDLLGFY